MTEQAFRNWDRQVRETAAALSYPPTPDVAGAVRRRLAAGQRPTPGAMPSRRLAWAALAALIALSLLLAVPEVRASVLEFLQIGAIRIFPTEEAPTTAPPATARLVPALAGETTLAEAEAALNFPIRLPAYPAGLGPPDRVFLQQARDPGTDWPVLILVWHDPEQPEQAGLTLYQIGALDYGAKRAAAENIEAATVNGQEAYWVTGPHQLQLESGEYGEWQWVEGNVLLWYEAGITYRLESGLPLKEAVRIAESLR